MGMLINFVAFQVGWFSAVIGAARGMPWAGVLVIAVIIAAHLASVRRPYDEFVLIVLCGLIGAVLDSALVAFGWVTYPSGSLFSNAAPYWIVAMWMLFATTLNVSMNWLKDRPALAVVCGMVGGPLAYYSGHKLGGIGFDNFPAAMIALGIGWGSLMPLLLGLAGKYDGVTARSGQRHGWILE